MIKPVWCVRELATFIHRAVIMYQVLKTTKSCFAGVQQIRSVQRSVTRSVLLSLVTSVVLWHLDLWECNPCRHSRIPAGSTVVGPRLQIRPHVSIGSKLHWLSLFLNALNSHWLQSVWKDISSGPLTETPAIVTTCHPVNNWSIQVLHFTSIYYTHLPSH